MRWEPPPTVAGFPETFGRGVTRLALRHYLGAKHLDRHHIPKTGPVILVANHPTLGDPFMLAFGTQRWVSWLAWDEAFDWPGVGSLMRLYKAIPLNLEKPKPSSLKAAYGVLARGRILGMFFEGERSFTYGLNTPLKTGAARMALRSGAIVVPCTVSGARRAWPREQALPGPGKIVVRYHPPIDPKTVAPELTRKERGELITRRLQRIIGATLPPEGTSRFYR
jgi:1-acyl-sn-glycerol-3-phosphate acyltransferase